jgi:hypothetical protein
MPVNVQDSLPPVEMPDLDQLTVHADHIRSSEVLGRSEQLHRLFEYLLACTRAGRTPKESVIAVDVFGRGTDFDVSQDAAVRVYIHKLRRKFDEFYGAHPQVGPGRLTIPKGEYRLVLENSGAERADVAPVPASRPRNPWRIATFACLGALAVLAIAAATLWLRTPEHTFGLVRGSPVWAKLLSDSRPITVVLGDYYIFAETGDAMEPKRLVREFFINSRNDLDQYLMDHPDLMDRYMDVQLGYLPTASAHVMADIMPLLASTHRPVRVTMMSDLTPEALKSTDIVYIGYLSGLGMLYDGTFAGSRFSIGSTFDELTDNRTRHRYMSQAGDRYMLPSDGPNYPGSLLYRDYSLVTEFAGPSGNPMLVIAGMRDVGLMQAGDAVTDRTGLEELAAHIDRDAPFEALYEVSGINSTGMASKLLVTSARAPGATWDHVAPAPDRLGSLENASAQAR